MSVAKMHLYGGIVLLLATCTIGCSDGVRMYPADGKVTFPDGKPLTGGWLEFVSAGPVMQPMPRADIQADGTFHLGTFTASDGACVGTYKVIVVPPMQASERNAADRYRSSVIDARFRSFETSGLEFTVTDDPAKNHFQIQIEGPRSASR